MGIGCVVMASGSSTRFGENKLMAPFLGLPLIQHTLQKLPFLLDRVLVVTRSVPVCSLVQDLGFECLLHTKPDLSDTIRLGIQSMERMTGCLFCVADQPICSRETIAKIITCFQRNPNAIVRACHGTTDGNPVLFSKSYFPELAALSIGQSGSTIIKKYPHAVLRVQVKSHLELCDADTPAALAALEALAEKEVY